MEVKVRDGNVDGAGHHFQRQAVLELVTAPAAEVQGIWGTFRSTTFGSLSCVTLSC